MRREVSIFIRLLGKWVERRVALIASGDTARRLCEGSQDLGGGGGGGSIIRRCMYTLGSSRVA